jgi:hypothetical protein
MSSAKSVAGCWLGAIALWLAMGFSLGWYYTFTYYGRAGWPMPVPEACASILIYYFSVLNVDTEIQAVHWMVCFPAAGVLWVAAAWYTAGRFGAERPPFHRVLIVLACASLPLALPAPWMTWTAGQTSEGFVWARMIAVALRRGGVSPWAWLSPMYLGLAFLALGLQVAAYRKLFAMPARKAWASFPASVILLILVVIVAGAAGGIPLRMLFE